MSHLTCQIYPVTRILISNGHEECLYTAEDIFIVKLDVHVVPELDYDEDLVLADRSLIGLLIDEELPIVGKLRPRERHWVYCLVIEVIENNVDDTTVKTVRNLSKIRSDIVLLL